MSEQWTSFNLLFPDGMVRVLFRALLTSDQYSELHGVVDAATSKEELAALARQLGAKWGISVIVEVDPV